MMEICTMDHITEYMIPKLRSRLREAGSEEIREEYRYLLRSFLWDPEPLSMDRRKEIFSLLFDSYLPESKDLEMNLYLLMRYLFRNIDEDPGFVLHYSRRYYEMISVDQRIGIYELLAGLIQRDTYRNAPASEEKVELLRMAYHHSPSNDPASDAFYSQKIYEIALPAVLEYDSHAGKKLIREFFHKAANIDRLTVESFPIIFDDVKKYSRSQIPVLRTQILRSSCRDKIRLARMIDEYEAEEKMRKLMHRDRSRENLRKLQEMLMRSRLLSGRVLFVFYGTEKKEQFLKENQDFLNLHQLCELPYQTAGADLAEETPKRSLSEQEFVKLMYDGKILSYTADEADGKTVFRFLSEPYVSKAESTNLFVYTSSLDEVRQFRKFDATMFQILTVSLVKEKNPLPMFHVHGMEELRTVI